MADYRRRLRQNTGNNCKQAVHRGIGFGSSDYLIHWWPDEIGKRIAAWIKGKRRDASRSSST